MLSSATSRSTRRATFDATANQTRAARSPEYRAQRAEREGFREIAWLLIKYRMDKGLSQQHLR